MAHSLEELDLFEVSLVKSPANPGAKVALFKAVEEDSDLLSQLFEKYNINKDDDIKVEDLVNIIKETKMDLTKIEDETLRKEIEELKEKAEKADGLSARIEELEKSQVPEEKPEEEIVKEDLPEVVQKALENAETLQKSYDEMIAKIQKIEDEKVTTAIHTELSQYTAVIAVDDLDARVELVKSLNDEAREQLYKDYAKAQEIQKQRNSLFSEVGSNVAAPSTAYEAIQKAGETFRESDSELTSEQAFSKAIDRNPDLYRQYQAELKGGN